MQENRRECCSTRWKVLTRLMIGIGLASLLAINSVLQFSVIEKEPVCIDDQLFKFTEVINKSIQTNQRGLLSRLTLIMTFLLLDISVVSLVVIFVVKGTNWKPVMTIVFELKDNDDMVWFNPGFPSLTMTYQKTNDFFSVAVGLFLICAVELHDYGYKGLSYMALFGTGLYFVIAILFRLSYYFSLFSGLLSSHYVCLISRRYHHLLNYFYEFHEENASSKSKHENDSKKVTYYITSQ